MRTISKLRRGQIDASFLVLIGFVGVIVWVAAGGLSGSPLALSVAKSGQSNNVASGAVATFDTSQGVTMNLALKQMFKEGTSATMNTTWRVKDMNGKFVSQATDSNSATPSEVFSADDTVQAVILGETADAYYGAVQEFTVPRKKSDNMQVLLYQEDSAPAVKVWSFDDGNLIASGNPEPLTTGEVVALDASIKASADKAYSVDDIVACYDYSTSAYDDVYVRYAGARAPSAPTPAHLKGTVEDCYYIGQTADNQATDFTIVIDTDDSTEPTLAHNITSYYVDQNYFINSLTGLVDMGPQDDSDTQLGQSDITDIIHVS